MNHLLPTGEEFSAVNANTLATSVDSQQHNTYRRCRFSVPRLIPLFIYGALGKADQHFVVGNVRIELKQILLVLRVIHGFVALGPGEGLDSGFCCGSVTARESRVGISAEPWELQRYIDSTMCHVPSRGMKSAACWKR